MIRAWARALLWSSHTALLRGSNMSIASPGTCMNLRSVSVLAAWNQAIGAHAARVGYLFPEIKALIAVGWLVGWLFNL